MLSDWGCYPALATLGLIETGGAGSQQQSRESLVEKSFRPSCNQYFAAELLVVQVEDCRQVFQCFIEWLSAQLEWGGTQWQRV
jgi:hypothetical protein